MTKKLHLQKIDGQLPTASQVARLRALEKIGLDLAWYNDRVEDNRDSNGDACCEACGKPETKRKPGGDIKDLVVDTKNKRLVCASCADKNYKKTKSENVSRRSDRDGAETAERWWERNLAKLSKEELREYDVREGDVVFLVHALNEHIVNPAFTQDLQENIQDFCAEIEKYGTLQYPHGPDWWKGESKHLTGANAVWFKYGFYTAIPDKAALAFFQFVEDLFLIRATEPDNYRKRIARIQCAIDGRPYVDPNLIVTCATRGCSNTEFRANITKNQFFCPTCEAERDRLARLFHSKLQNEKLQDAILKDGSKDSWGRDNKVFGERGPYRV